MPRWWHNPNLWTHARFAVALAVMALPGVDPEALWLRLFLAGSLVFALITDHLDGRFSRQYGMVSDFGKIWDPAADCAYFLCLWLALWQMGLIWTWMLALVMLRELLQNLFLRPYMLFVRRMVVAASGAGKTKLVLQCVIGGALLLLLLAEHEAVARLLTGGASARVLPEEYDYQRMARWSFGVVLIASLASAYPYWRALAASARPPAGPPPGAVSVPATAAGLRGLGRFFAR